jgi:hypothetical protein
MEWITTATALLMRGATARMAALVLAVRPWGNVYRELRPAPAVFGVSVQVVLVRSLMDLLFVATDLITTVMALSMTAVGA